jgi:hypothetical protein
MTGWAKTTADGRGAIMLLIGETAAVRNRTAAAAASAP